MSFFLFIFINEGKQLESNVAVEGECGEQKETVRFT